jgi:hypothetical protein
LPTCLNVLSQCGHCSSCPRLSITEGPLELPPAPELYGKRGCVISAAASTLGGGQWAMGGRWVGVGPASDDAAPCKGIVRELFIITAPEYLV